MKCKVLFTWLVLLLSSHAFAQNILEKPQYFSNLCQTIDFGKGNSKVQAFCLTLKQMPRPDCFEPFSKRGTLPVTSKSGCIPGPAFKEKQLILVSGGDLQAYSTEVIANHLKFAALWGMTYFYADAKHFRQQNDFLKPHWLKVQLLKDMLTAPSIPEHSWIAWVDDDLVLSDSNRYGVSMLDIYIRKYGSESSVIITTDTYPWPGEFDEVFNTGVVLVKKNEISRELFSDWWNKKPASAEAQEHYIPPNQFGLKLVLEEHDYLEPYGSIFDILPRLKSWDSFCKTAMPRHNLTLTIAG